MEWYIKALKRYAEFSGRSRRSEYWFFALFNCLAALVFLTLMIAGAAAGSGTLVTIGGLLYNVYGLAVLIPGVAVSIRRLHDTNHSGWWLLIAFTGIGGIVLLIWFIQDSDAGTNQFGPNPKLSPSMA